MYELLTLDIELNNMPEHAGLRDDFLSLKNKINEIIKFLNKEVKP